MAKEVVKIWIGTLAADVKRQDILREHVMNFLRRQGCTMIRFVGVIQACR